MNQIIAHNQQLAQVQFYTSIGKDWQQFFSIEHALADVYMHIQALPSSLTPEKHTQKAYDAGLRHFLNFMIDQLPTPQLVNHYIALLRQSGRSASTISSKYLAPTRLFLSKLADQRPLGLKGDEHDFAYDCQDQIMRAARVKAPAQDTTNYEAPLLAHGNRISKGKILTILRYISTNTTGTLLGHRDYFLYLLAFSTGLRLAEIQRLSKSCFYEDDEEQWWIRVRGKRNNITPIPVDSHLVFLMEAYIDAYNKKTETPITPITPLMQPLFKGDKPAPLRVGGMSTNSISDIMGRWSEVAIGIKLSPHDFRRTFATICLKDGWDLAEISKALRHCNLATTTKYVGMFQGEKRKTVRLI